MKKTLYISMFLLGGLCALIGCKPEVNCYMQEKVRARVIFLRTLEDNTSTNQIDSLTVKGLGMDKYIVNNAKSVKQVSLPLRADTCVSQYMFAMGEIVDTLTVYHQPKPFYVSLACGCFIYQTIDSVRYKGKLFNDYDIINAAIENVEQDNICLYLLR